MKWKLRSQEPQFGSSEKTEKELFQPLQPLQYRNPRYFVIEVMT